MATYKVSDSVGQKEDLSDIITKIDPDETPLFSNMKKVTTKGITHEWQVQELASAVSTNYVNEGADYSYVNPSATTRLGNVHQIFAQSAKFPTPGRIKESAELISLGFFISIGVTLNSSSERITEPKLPTP